MGVIWLPYLYKLIPAIIILAIILIQVFILIYIFKAKLDSSKEYEEDDIDKRYPIGTEVKILEDCRRIKRATNKKGKIIKFKPYIIPADYFPMDLGDGVKLHIDDLDNKDMLIKIPVIKYGKIAKIRGDQCWWEAIK